MSLLVILIYVVAALTLLAGVSLFLGSAKPDRSRMVWYMGISVSATVWCVSIALFMSIKEDNLATIIPIVAGIYIGGAMLAVSVIGFAAWKYTWGKIVAILSTIIYATMLIMVLNNHSIFFSGHTISAVQGNSMQLVNGWMYWLYTAMLVLDNVLAWYAFSLHAKRTRNKRIRKSDYVILVGFIITGVFACVFDAILPMFRYDLIWIGPVSVCVAILSIYYAMLRYRVVAVSSGWMKVASTIVLASSGVFAYMMIFYLIFTALFKIPSPSPSILVLNFLMIVIVLLLMPVLSELKAQIGSMISVGQVDIAYVIKKLNRLATKNVDLRELAAFLADHLHFNYIGFLINGRIYGSKPLAISSEELAQIVHMKATGREIWQEPNKTTQKTMDQLDIKAVAELRNAKGKAFGQLVVGKPMGKISFERRDLIQLEMIINLVATIVDSEKHLRA